MKSTLISTSKRMKILLQDNQNDFKEFFGKLEQYVSNSINVSQETNRINFCEIQSGLFHINQ